MANSSYIHLTNKSTYSLSWGAIHPKELVNEAAAYNMPALGITDRFNFFCALEFSLACADKGIQPIIGIDINLIDDVEQKSHGIITLFAQHKQGFTRLSHLISNAYEQDTPPLMIDGPYVTIDNLRDMEGVMALGAYDNGVIGHYLQRNEHDRANNFITRMQHIFDDRFYMDITRHNTPKQHMIEPHYVELADANNIPLLATNNCHFLTPEFYSAHEILLCIQAQTTLDDDKHPHLSAQHYFKPPTDMEHLFHDLPDAITNTLEFSKRCHFMVERRSPILPSFAPSPEDENEQLRHITLQGLEQRFHECNIKHEAYDKDSYIKRANYELDIIISMGFAGYFLIVADFIKHAKDSGIPVGPGRGSGAGSIVAWSCGITNLNPMTFGLLFERFLNPERVSMPDFDIDFCQDKRQQIIEYVQQKYGADKVAQIITFGSLQAKAAIRDVGRVLGMPYGQVDRVSKLIPFRLSSGKPVTIANTLACEKTLKDLYSDDSSVNNLLNNAMRLEGMLRNASTHAAGVVIAGQSLANLVPLYRDPRSSLPVTQYNMKFVEQAGLVKFDFLGLKTLSVIKLTLEYIKQTRQQTINIDTISLTDAATYSMLQSGHALGVFQFESTGMRNVLRQMKPDQFTDLIAAVALYRPGPMDNIPSYIKRKHKLEDVSYPHPILEEVLSETYGIPIYQEQVMQIGQLLAGYTLGGADLLRRAMGKKDKDEMQRQQNIFIEGAHKNHGLNEEQAKNIFTMIEAFAGYGFNKSHAAAYALISYQTAYLKTHYPHEFLAASMTYDIDNPDKVKLFIDEAKRLHIPILPLNVNISKSNFDIALDDNHKPTAIYYALSAIKNISDKAISSIVEIREQKQSFIDIWDLCRSVSPQHLNKKMIEHLAAAGAFDVFDQYKREDIYHNASMIMRYMNEYHEQKQSLQESLFRDEQDTQSPQLNISDTWNDLETLNHEFDALGLYLSRHPFSVYKPYLKKHDITPIDSIESMYKKSCIIAGIITAKREMRTKKGKLLCFITLSDDSGSCDVTLFEEQYQRYRNDLTNGAAIMINIGVEYGEVTRMTGVNVQLLAYDNATMNDSALTITLNNLDVLPFVHDMITQHKTSGKSPVYIKYNTQEEELVFALPDPITISDEFCKALRTNPALIVDITAL